MNEHTVALLDPLEAEQGRRINGWQARGLLKRQVFWCLDQHLGVLDVDFFPQATWNDAKDAITSSEPPAVRRLDEDSSTIRRKQLVFLRIQSQGDHHVSKVEAGRLDAELISGWAPCGALLVLQSPCAIVCCAQEMVRWHDPRRRPGEPKISQSIPLS